MSSWRRSPGSPSSCRPPRQSRRRQSRPTLSRSRARPGSEVAFTLRFPSKARSFTVLTDWGDGSVPTTLQGSSSATTKRAQLTHSFAQPGTFVVTVTVGRLQATRSIIITAAATADPSPTPSATTSAAEEWQIDMLARLNALRASLGAPAVQLCAPLSTAAAKHSADMANRGYFDHTGLDGRSPSARAAAEGYSSGVGENIAAGYDSVADVMGGWIDSPGHYANLINADYRVVGFGRVSVPDSPYGVYWTQNFGRRSC